MMPDKNRSDSDFKTSSFVNTTKLKSCLLFDNYLLCKSWLKQSHGYSNVNKFKIWIPPLDPESDSRILHVKKKPLEIGNICPKS